LFAREVMPHVRDLWSDWEDKWSPRPLAESERAMPAPVELAKRETNGRVAPGANVHGESRSAK